MNKFKINNSTNSIISNLRDYDVAYRFIETERLQERINNNVPNPHYMLDYINNKDDLFRTYGPKERWVLKFNGRYSSFILALLRITNLITIKQKVINSSKVQNYEILLSYNELRALLKATQECQKNYVKFKKSFTRPTEKIEDTMNNIIKLEKELNKIFTGISQILENDTGTHLIEFDLPKLDLNKSINT